MLVLGIDTSNYTTSVSLVSEDKVILDLRKALFVKIGEKGLRQSEALFQHVINLPELFENFKGKKMDAVCVSIKPRPVEGSYMPVFRAGESFAKVISLTNSIPLFLTTHQEGHIEAAVRSIDFNYTEFIALHLSGGTSEVLHVQFKDDYYITKIGGTKDISIGQFLDRVGVALGYNFPSGKKLDELALNSTNKNLRIPSKVDGYFFNFSGQETMALRYINEGKASDEIAYAVMLCAAKTLEKLINNLIKYYKLPIILIGGVSSSKFIREYLKNKFDGMVYFSKEEFATDNAVGVAYIGLKKLLKGDYNGSLRD
ncbi:N6-L-threonylcarbamoyladenine synthase [Caloramator fervidus]|uniref:N6-L-threonylcarbamoyladenine synthase n=1 Tax=Caloramator fervidus TaxID=29344 RepID=A0A1H5V4Z0_9CLOT|nr:O-sialoglycoprotein endopeptidase [Caloramator fervidus]SEF82270.1 N6-L-threonylcarbamoyladenine synthase [Caloramator fervidus]